MPSDKCGEGNINANVFVLHAEKDRFGHYECNGDGYRVPYRLCKIIGNELKNHPVSPIKFTQPYSILRTPIMCRLSSYGVLSIGVSRCS